MDRFDVTRRRRARLQMAVVPPFEVLDLFRPDDEGRLQEVTQSEARARGLDYYLSRRLSVLDKVLETHEQVAVVVRDSRTGLSLGETELAKQANDRQVRQQDAADIRRALSRASGKS